jgi:hypothetical protein
MRVDSCNEVGFGNRRFVSRGLFLSALLIGAPLVLTPSQSRASVFTVNMTEQGSNVVANGSGSFNLTGLFLQSPGGDSSASISPTFAELGMGVSGFFADGYANNGSFGPGLVGPSNFGTGGTSTPSSGSGSDFLFVPGEQLVLPQGYVSDTALTDSSTYANSTFASLGITPGNYTWTWDENQNSLVLNVIVPEPSSLLLFGVGMFGIVARRRRRPVA